ncbi:MAG: response regulator transcription factor [Armatimonadetes bacterium]|nr:response regulator transcription factor [Armatimonadota bacterium]
MTHRVLVVEDDRDIAALVQLHLRDLGMETDIAHDGLEGWQKLSAASYDLVVLDIALPRMDGLEICRRLRARPQYTLILMLTSKSSELDRVLGLELGADDYLTKPFSIRELLARVKALFRRAEALHETEATAASPDCPGAIPGHEGSTIRSGELCIEVDKRKVAIGEELVALTAKEFGLLYLLACHPGRVYTRTQLLDSVWGLGFEGYEHTVNSHINRLRNKIEKDPTHPRYLLTVWGVGYKFTEATAQAEKAGPRA